MKMCSLAHDEEGKVENEKREVLIFSLICVDELNECCEGIN